MRVGTLLCRHLSYGIWYIHLLVSQKQRVLLCIVVSEEGAELPPSVLPSVTCLIAAGEGKTKESQYG